MSEWQSIETAPVDGTEVWLSGNASGDPADAWVERGFFYEAWRGADDEEVLNNPTHWMPFFIPMPPTV